jgi:hypothetical protein
MHSRNSYSPGSVQKTRKPVKYQVDGQGELLNGFHGDPNNKNRFRINPRYVALETKFDTHLKPNKFCRNYVKVKKGDMWEYLCQGHGTYRKKA